RFGQSLLRQYHDETPHWGSNLTVELQPDLGKNHEFSVLAGYNVEHSQLERLNASRDGLLVPSKPDYNLTDGLNYSLACGGVEWAYQGIFYRINYDYKNRYLLELNGRYDGSSKFPANQRIGFFPSVSAGWNLAEEPFMEATRSWLDQLKIQSSYGSLGNGNVAPYRYMEAMS